MDGRDPSAILLSTSRTLAVIAEDEVIVIGVFSLDGIDERACKIVMETGNTVIVIDGPDIDTMFKPADGGVIVVDMQRDVEAFMPWSEVFDDGN